MWTIPKKLERKFKDYNYTELSELIRKNELKDLDNASKADIYVQYSLLLYRERNDKSYAGSAKEQPFFIFSKLKGLDKVFREYLNDIEKECYLGATKYFNQKDIKKLNLFIDEFLKFQAHISLFFIVYYASKHEKNAQTFLSHLIDSTHLKTLHSLDDNSIIREHFIRAYVSAIFAKLLYLVEAGNISKLYYESSIYFGGSFTGTLEIIGIEPVESKFMTAIEKHTIPIIDKACDLGREIYKHDISNIFRPMDVAKLVKKINNIDRSAETIKRWFKKAGDVIPPEINKISNSNSHINNKEIEKQRNKQFAELEDLYSTKCN